MKMSHALSLAAFSLTAGSAFGQLFSGDTTGDPTYNRALDDFSALSGIGTAVNFETILFTVTVTGSYTYQNSAVGLWDNYSFIYQNAFNPATPLINGLIGNDDNPGIGQSGFTTNLTAGATYIYVTTGFGNGDQGLYNLEVRGNGHNGIMTVIPAPSALAVLGLGGLLAARRRR